MSKDRPMFSIVMPTRNRAHWLPYALQSALDQTFDDCEIVVSDNCSSDDTAKVVQQVGGARVRYVRTDRALPMHDSWEFALSHARGEWITYLCDDDALYPQALQRIAASIRGHQQELVCWAAGWYILDTPSPECLGRQGQVALFRATGRTFDITSRSQILALFKVNSNYLTLPRMENSCCQRALVEKVKRQLGRFFPPPFPDYTSCVAVLAKTDTYTYIDDPLILHGRGSHVHSVSPTYNKPTDHIHLFDDFQGERVLEHVPLSFLTAENGIAECLLRMRNAMPEELSGLEIDRAGYFVGCYLDTVSLARNGVDVSAMRKELFALLARESLLVQARVRASLLGPTLRSLFRGGIARDVLLRLGILRLLDATIRRRKRKIIGWNGGFANILEAVRYVSQGSRGHSQRLGHDAG